VGKKKLCIPLAVEGVLLILTTSPPFLGVGVAIPLNNLNNLNNIKYLFIIFNLN